MATADYLVQSLERAASILTAFSAEAPALTMGQIVQHSGLPRSTAHRLVVNLLRLGFLSRDPQTDTYRLGLLLAELGAVALSGLDLRQRARPVMERLATQTGEAVLLAVLDGHWSVYVEKIEGRHALRMTATVGGRKPLHCTATGNTLLAYLPEERVRQILAEAGLPRLTGRTLTALEPLLARLATIRQQGYAVDDGESEEGLAGIAAPVRGADGAVVAALVVAGPTPRMLPGGRPALAPAIIAAADEIAAALGYRPPAAVVGAGR